MADAEPEIYARERYGQNLAMQSGQLLIRSRPYIQARASHHARPHHLRAKGGDGHQAVHPRRGVGRQRICRAVRTLYRFRECLDFGDRDLLFLQRGDLGDPSLARAPLLRLANKRAEELSCAAEQCPASGRGEE